MADSEKIQEQAAAPAPEEIAQETASLAGEGGQEEETQAASADASAKKSQLRDDIMEILETMIVSVFFILLVFSYLVRPVTVDGWSMVPTLNNEDRLVMFRLFYDPKPGNIVVVNDYEGHILVGDEVVPSSYSLNECLIKRVIAVGGQQLDIDFEKGIVYVDGKALDEPYTNAFTLPMHNDGAFTYPFTIPEGYIFVMGDNRNHSTDSRSASVGLIKEEDVLGRAFFRYYAAKDPNYQTGTIGFLK